MSKYEVYNNTDGTMPHPLTADENGFLCNSLMEDTETLIMGYRYGIFPWENVMNVGAYFFPEKRYLIEPGKIKIHKSMRPYFNQNKFVVTVDQYFREVVYSCRYVKRNENTTWITDQFEIMYGKLHDQGYAHSIEVWQDDGLVGGLYGVAIGDVFTGESMFSYVSNASKFAMIYLAKLLEYKGFKYIDCQIYNPYLATFGGKDMTNLAFLNIMRENLKAKDKTGQWNYLDFTIIGL
jgi:leucyl/phenylalanyl-tRNA---protein transferase